MKYLKHLYIRMWTDGIIASFGRFWQVRSGQFSVERELQALTIIKRSYASDYVAIALLITVYMLVCSLHVIARRLTDLAQIQFFVEPFHRMFFLDNLSIQYPHAEVERVSVCTYNAAFLSLICIAYT